MSVRKRKGSPHYWYDFTVAGLRFRGSTETDDPETAKTVEATLRRDAVLNQHLRRKPRITLDDAFARYWKEHAQFLASSFRIISYTSRQMLDFFGKSLPLDELSDERVSAFVAHLRTAPLGQNGRHHKKIQPASVNRKLIVLGSMLGRARGWGVEMPELSIRRHRLIAPEGRTRWITPAEADKLIGCATPHLRPIIRFALLTTARLSNITGLTWEQVDMHARIIHLRVKSKLPGGKLLEVPISGPLLALLAEQGPKASGRVFPYTCIRASFNTACRRAGISDFRFHDLRHTAASWMIQNGVPLDVVQQVLGHSNISQTQKYAHRRASDRLSALDTLAAAQMPGQPGSQQEERKVA